MDRKQYIKELRWTPQVSEGFLYIDLILHRHVHLIMHTLISISAHIHMKHKKWCVTCVWAKNIYIRIHVSQLASAPRQSSKVDKHSHLFLLLSLQKLSEEFTDSFIKFMLSFFSYIFFFFASLEHFMNAKSEAVPNDFSPRVIFCWGGNVFI